MPYAVALLATIEFFVKRGTRSLSFLLFVLFITVMSEFVFKRILKDPRPEKTCLHSCGMPSSHSSLSLGYFWLMFMDGTWRLWNHRKGIAHEPGAISFWHWWKALRRVRSAVPLMESNQQVSAPCFIMWVIFWFVLLFPVPVARVLLSDHTPSQVLVGSIIGMLEAGCWFVLLLRCERCSRRHYGKRRFGILHDFRLPDQWVRDVHGIEMTNEPSEERADLGERFGPPLEEALEATPESSKEATPETSRGSLC